MERLLIIITRGKGEFEQYWKGKSDNAASFSLPVIYTSDGYKAIIINGADLIRKGATPLKRLRLILSRYCSEYGRCNQLGIISHGHSEYEHFYKIIRGRDRIAFNLPYSSSTDKLCGRDGDNFIIHDNPGDKPLDVFRNAVIGHQDSPESFKALWSCFAGDLMQAAILALAHDCYAPETLAAASLPQEISSKEFQRTFNKFRTGIRNDEGGYLDFASKAYISELKMLKESLLKLLV